MLSAGWVSLTEAFRGIDDVSARLEFFSRHEYRVSVSAVVEAEFIQFQLSFSSSVHDLLFLGGWSVVVVIIHLFVCRAPVQG